MKNYTVYQITNKINDNIYIGCHVTDNIYDNYMGSGTNIRKAIDDFGKENFDKIILHNFDNKEEMMDMANKFPLPESPSEKVTEKPTDLREYYGDQVEGYNIKNKGNKAWVILLLFILMAVLSSPDLHKYLNPMKGLTREGWYMICVIFLFVLLIVVTSMK